MKLLLRVILRLFENHFYVKLFTEFGNDKIKALVTAE